MLAFPYTGLIARKLYEDLRREVASICLQKYARAHRARKAYTQLRASTVVIQTGLRAMAARNEYRHRRRTKASIIVQVENLSPWDFFFSEVSTLI